MRKGELLPPLIANMISYQSGSEMGRFRGPVLGHHHRESAHGLAQKSREKRIVVGQMGRLVRFCTG